MVYTFTYDDCIKWKANPDINPKTGRKINNTGVIYKSLMEQCNKLNKPQVPVQYNMVSQFTKPQSPVQNKTQYTFAELLAERIGSKYPESIINTVENEIKERGIIINTNDKHIILSIYELLYIDAIMTENINIFPPIEEFIPRGKPLNLSKILLYSTYYMEYLESTKNKSRLFADIEVGDILCYSSSFGFPFGHNAIALGQTIYIIRSKQHDVYIPVLFRAENPSFPTAVNIIELLENKPRLKLSKTQFVYPLMSKTAVITGTPRPPYKIDVEYESDSSYFSKETIQKTNEYLNNIYTSNTLDIVRYIGPQYDKVRALVGLISYALIVSDSLQYGGICYLLTKQCFNIENLKERIESYREMVKNNRIESVCSGFSVFVYQLTFDILGFSINEIAEMLPINSLACRPNHILELPTRFPKYWTATKSKGWPNFNVNVKFYSKTFEPVYIPLSKTSNQNNYYINNGELLYTSERTIR